MAIVVAFDRAERARERAARMDQAAADRAELARELAAVDFLRSALVAALAEVSRRFGSSPAEAEELLRVAASCQLDAPEIQCP